MSRKSDADEKRNEFDEFNRGALKPIAGGVAGAIIGFILGGSDGAVAGGLIGSFSMFLGVFFFAKES